MRHRHGISDEQWERIQDLLPGKGGEPGVNTKIHTAVNGLGLPVKIVLTPGLDADVTQAETLLNRVPFEVVIADKG